MPNALSLAYNNKETHFFTLPRELIQLILTLFPEEDALSTLCVLSQVSYVFSLIAQDALKTLPIVNYTSEPTFLEVTLKNGYQEEHQYNIYRRGRDPFYSPFYTDWIIGHDETQHQLKAWSLIDDQEETISDVLTVFATTPKGDVFLINSSSNCRYFRTWDLTPILKDAGGGVAEDNFLFLTHGNVLLPDKKTLFFIPNENEISVCDITAYPFIATKIEINSHRHLPIIITKIIVTLDGNYFIPIPEYLVDGLAIWSVAEKKLAKELLPKTTEVTERTEQWIWGPEICASVSYDSKWIAVIHQDQRTNEPTTCLQWRIDPHLSQTRTTFELSGIGKASNLDEISYTRDNFALVGLLSVEHMNPEIRIWSTFTGQCLYHFSYEGRIFFDLRLPSTGEIVISTGPHLRKFKFPKTQNIAEIASRFSSKKTEPLPVNFSGFFSIFIFSAIVSLISILLTLTLASPLINLLKLFNVAFPLQGAGLLATTAAVFFGAAFLVGVAIACIASAINSCRTSEKADEVILTTTKNDALSKNNTAILQTIGHHFTALFKPSLEENAKKARTAPEQKQTSSIPHRTNFFM